MAGSINAGDQIIVQGGVSKEYAQRFNRVHFKSNHEKTKRVKKIESTSKNFQPVQPDRSFTLGGAEINPVYIPSRHPRKN